MRKLIDKTSLYNVRVCLCFPDKDNIKIKRDDGLTIAGSLYGVEASQKRPGILLLHGKTAIGRNLAMYRVLAEKLAERGYLVLTIDFTGYGESDNRFSLDRKEALNRDRDVFAALSYLNTLNNLEQNQVYVIAHSGGTDPAFSVSISHPNVKSIVSIGPPRRNNERLFDPSDRDKLWKREQLVHQKVYSKDFPSWYTKEVWVKQRIDGGMDNYLSYFSQPKHLPLLLIDGELENEKDKAYLQNYYTKIAEPKKYVTIPNSDHYMNTEKTQNYLRLLFFDIEAVTEHVNAIDNFFQSSGSN